MKEKLSVVRICANIFNFVHGNFSKNYPKIEKYSAVHRKINISLFVEGFDEIPNKDPSTEKREIERNNESEGC